jgi:Tfp pilus assembly protein PilW
MRKQETSHKQEAGFSLYELIIAMVITLSVMTIAMTMIAKSLKVRARENKRTDAMADAQRAMNLMSHEIANAGFRMKTNGIVWQDSNDDNSIRILANLNKYTGETDNGVTESGEDVKFFISDNTQYLVRYDKNRPSTDPLQKTVLANRVYSLYVYYFTQPVNYTTGTCDTPVTVTTSGVSKLSGSNIANAKYIVLALCVDLPAEGTPGSPGYQPASQTLLVSDIALRNANALYY